MFCRKLKQQHHYELILRLRRGTPQTLQLSVIEITASCNWSFSGLSTSMNGCAHCVLHLSASQTRTFPLSLDDSPTLHPPLTNLAGRSCPRARFSSHSASRIFSHPARTDFLLVFLGLQDCTVRSLQSTPSKTCLVLSKRVLLLSQQQQPPSPSTVCTHPGIFLLPTRSYPLPSLAKCAIAFSSPYRLPLPLGNVVIPSFMQSSLASAHFALRVLITNDCLINFSLSQSTLCPAVPNQAQ